MVDAVWERSQGNPFFAEELTVAGHDAALPSSLRGLILTRVDGLSPHGRQVLRLAAVAGNTVEHEMLTAVGDVPADALDTALTEAVDTQILLVDPDWSGYRFRHALLREAVYGSLLPGERTRLHRLVAEALTADASLGPSGPGHRAAELAAHRWAATEWAPALHASMAAAEAAVEVWAFPEGLAHFERALLALDRLPETTPPPVDRSALLERASDAAYLAGAGQRSVELAIEAIEAFDPATNPSAAARCYAMLGRNAWAMGDSDRAFGAYHQAAELVPADPPSEALARVMAEQARGLMLMSRFTESEPRCVEALEVALAVGARAVEGHIRYTLGCCRASLGHYDEGIDLVRQALAIAEEVANPDDLNRAFMGLSSLLVESGQLEEGATLVFASAAKGEELWGMRLNGAAGNSTEALIRLGRIDEAEALLAQTGGRGAWSCTPGPPMLRASMAIRTGRFDEAAEHLVTADELTAQLTDVQGRGWFHMLEAELALLEGRPSDGYEAIERALDLAAGTDDEYYRPEMCGLGVRCLADRAEEARARGQRFDADKARLLAQGLTEEAARIVAAPTARGGRCPPRTRALASMGVAEASRLERSEPELWAAAAARWDDANEPYPAAYCRWRQAEALLEGRAARGQASDVLQEAWTVSTELGVLPLQADIERLAQRARIPLSSPDGREPDDGAAVGADLGLTQREVEVLGQLARGRTDREIAEQLFISKKTASVHVSNILRKLDVTNRVEAGRIGQAHGLDQADLTI